MAPPAWLPLLLLATRIRADEATDDEATDAAPKKRTVKSGASSSTFERLASTPTKARAAKTDGDDPKTPQSQIKLPRKPRSDGPSIFDKLTDPKLFTGTRIAFACSLC